MRGNQFSCSDANDKPEIGCQAVIDPATERIWLLCIVTLLCAVSFVAVSHQSFWIDEFTTFHFASQPSIKVMWQEMLRLKWPELQAPFYMVYIWIWQHLFGTGEWVSRLAGVPWFVFGATLFVKSLQSPLQRICALVVVALNPFTWFYLNEARLYSIELGLTYLAIAALICLQRAVPDGGRFEGRWLTLLCLSICLLALLTVLGMIWLSALFLILSVLVSPRKVFSWVRDHPLLLVSTFSVLVLCSGYYLWTRSLGTRAAGLWGSGWGNVGFIAYEQLGFNGLGPGRLALRESGLSALKPWLFPIGLYAAVIGTVFIAGIRQLVRTRNLKLAFLASFALTLPLCFLVAVGFLMNFRLLGRHCTPTVAALALFLTLGVANLWQWKHWWTRLALASFLSLSLLSCLSQRFAARHAKDDYRSAAQIAKAALAQSKIVWWNADPFGCEYYEVSSSRVQAYPGAAWAIMNPVLGFESGTVSPDLVIVSKPDAYDSLGGVQHFLNEKRYVKRGTPPAFAIFERSN